MTDQEIIDRVRFLLGGISETILPDDIILLLIQMSDETTDCEIVYDVLLESLLWLIRKALITSGSSGGVFKEREEQRGKTRIRVQYGDSSVANVIDPWVYLYNDYIEHPEYVCESLVDILTTNGTYLYIGGVSKAKKDAVETNPDSCGAGISIGWMNDLG